nr:aldo/keto reductase [Streptococcus anginosus]
MIGARIGVSAAQVALRWALQRGDVIFPKSVTPSRQAQNLDVFSFTLSDEDMTAIDALDEGEA